MVVLTLRVFALFALVLSFGAATVAVLWWAAPWSLLALPVLAWALGRPRSSRD